MNNLVPQNYFRLIIRLEYTSPLEYVLMPVYKNNNISTKIICQKKDGATEFAPISINRKGIVMTTGNLILTRKAGQRVMIGDDIVVEILHAEKGETRLLFNVPKDIEVHREEVYWRIHDESTSQEA